MKKRVLTFIAGVAVIAAVIMSVNLYLFQQKLDTISGITRAEAAKMIAYALADEDTFISAGDNWYDRYVEYVNTSGYMNIEEPLGKLTYADVRILLDKLDKEEPYQRITEGKEDSEIIDKNDFVNLYIDLIGEMDRTGTVHTIKTIVVATPSNSSKTKTWQVYTADGIYDFEGLVLDNAIDKNVSLIVKNDKVLCVQAVFDEDIVYKNVWIVSGTDKKITANVYGIEREFQVNNLSENIESVMADINMSNKKVKSLSIKSDTISGKVLSITNEYVEIEGYGKVNFDADYKIYNNYREISLKKYTDVVIGYSLQDFIVANGEICGAIISQPLKADNVRVLIKTTDFNGLFHSVITATCKEDFIIYYDEQEEKHSAGEVININSDSEYLTNGRMRIVGNNNAPISIQSISRNQGYPEYEGIMEISLYDNKLVLINEVSIEDYLKKVVPSEMPVNFGVEALKVQAICARSYAYKQLNNSIYSKYGAHMDDSTLFQVYNNVNENEISNTAISDTAGEVITYNGDVVETYYYSTSCGYTTDVSIWGTDAEKYPYFKAQSVSQEANEIDLTNEETFTAFIKDTNYKDYDKDFPLYRWKLITTADKLSESFNKKIQDRYIAYPDKILTLTSDGTFVSKAIKTVGTIEDIIVEKRVAGGAVNSLIVKGSLAVIKITGENHIRYLFGMSNTPLITTNGELKAMSSLPSTFCIFEKTSEGEYSITGGGFGHGIGMSQNAVYAMTNRNMSYIDIIEFFYNNVKIEAIS